MPNKSSGLCKKNVGKLWKNISADKFSAVLMNQKCNL